MEPLVKADSFDLDRCLAEAEQYPEQAHDEIPDEHLASVKSMAAAPPMPVAARCLTEFKAVHDSGARPREAIIWLVVHDEEAPTAIAAASWFTKQASGGSAHVCSDANVCYRTLPDLRIAWGAPGANFHGLHFEQAGFAAWSRSKWMTTGRGTIRRTAYKLALHAIEYDIPLRLLTAPQLRAGFKGVTDHRRCTAAFGGTHHDCGFGYPFDVLMADAKKFRAQLA